MNWFTRKRREIKLEVLFNQLAFLHQEMLDGNAKETDEVFWKSKLDEASELSKGIKLAEALFRQHQLAFEQFELEVLRKGEIK